MQRVGLKFRSLKMTIDPVALRRAGKYGVWIAGILFAWLFLRSGAGHYTLGVALAGSAIIGLAVFLVLVFVFKGIHL
jgi:hypothetical protein